eukprot:1526616-Pleurochrysis_carterae.AAC.1
MSCVSKTPPTATQAISAVRPMRLPWTRAKLAGTRLVNAANLRLSARSIHGYIFSRSGAGMHK